MGDRKLFRRVRLPDVVAGQLYLHSMPGRYEPLEASLAEAARLRIDRIVCLVPPAEIAYASPAYERAIAEGRLPCDREAFPIPDFGVPEDRRAFAGLVSSTAARLREGGRILVHCHAGIGRTGTFATCVLLELGLSAAEAEEAMRKAGSHPEILAQRQLINWFKENMHSGSR